MGSHLSPRFKKWMKKCLEDEFSATIKSNLDGERDPYDVAQKIINSREMTELTHTIRTSFVEQIDASRATTRQNSAVNSAMNSAANSRPQTALSYASDLSADDWSLKESTDEIGQIVEQMGNDKPDHVRLAGYEALLETDLANISTNNSWVALLKALRDGLIDGSRSVFDASLLLHAKLLSFPHFSDAYTNLLNAFAELYQSKKLSDTLPTLVTGVNFKIFLHEKLFRVTKLVLDHHEEIIKSIRTTDKPVEDMIDEFVSFSCSHSIMNVSQKKQLNTLHIVSIIEPQAGWSKKWMHSLITRRTLCTAISKSPSLLQDIVSYVKKGLESPPTRVAVAVSDEPTDVFVSGDSVETFTFLHCLNLLAQLCSYATGRSLLSETLTEDSFSIPDFFISLLDALNVLASSSTIGVYETIRGALYGLLRRPVVLYDARFYQAAISPLVQSEIKMWPHTLDVLTHMLDTADGPTFLLNEYRVGSASLDKKDPKYPVVTILTHASNILRQPIAVIGIEHVANLFKFIGKLFELHEIFYIVEETVREKFYPSLTYMYSKIDKYYVENENKTQRLDKAVKAMLLHIVSIPLGLQMLSNEPLVFEELIRGSIVPVRASWSAYNIVSFVSNSGFLSRGTEILANLAPHVLSTLLVELSKILEDPQKFYEPWENADVQVFLHVLAIFSLNTNCFIAFMATENEDDKEELEEESEYLKNLNDLFQHFSNVDSPYHHLGLLSLKVVLWNLDVYIYLKEQLDFENKMLEFQSYGHFVNESKLEPTAGFVVDESSLLRHSLLLDGWYLRMRRSAEPELEPEETKLFASLPPPTDSFPEDQCPRAASNSELVNWLSDSGPGLRDEYWVIQTRRAHKASPGFIKSSVLLDLLEQMEQAVPTVEWTDHFKWDPDLQHNDDLWLPEEKRGFELVIHYSKIYGILDNNDEQAKMDLKFFIQLSYDFINYKKSTNFEGFDWFLATVFLICNGDINIWPRILRSRYWSIDSLTYQRHQSIIIGVFVMMKTPSNIPMNEMAVQRALMKCTQQLPYEKLELTKFHHWLDRSKTFISQILRFPSAMLMWPALGQLVDENNDEEASTKLLSAHLLETIITLEFPTIKFALKRECGIDWWMICDRLLSQCFLGILPWSEILHYFAICILHPPDYVIYYCASLLNHCEDSMMKNIMNKKMWPEAMILEDYRCHSQIGFMDRLGKRHGGKVLPPLTQRKLSFPDNPSTTN